MIKTIYILSIYICSILSETPTKEDIEKQMEKVYEVVVFQGVGENKKLIAAVLHVDNVEDGVKEMGDKIKKMIEDKELTVEEGDKKDEEGDKKGEEGDKKEEEDEGDKKDEKKEDKK
ncbi:hypothetical protein EDEG_02004 [Edhazardia aedis USNM 41457]|uniref:Uncharacterized protein n=1 Tax=Edhazardia aedis (strain USNM 41457) TaxID=1003232 RepID=J9D843_EDHAE|nr:hypothetical protein EDEG_02004 [Edhazardia aedis USNM 41457]|eukprot:EJW03674.1 hypothetical protein EDEG_02004 [Edhazardia aedis USNM 41457]